MGVTGVFPGWARRDRRPPARRTETNDLTYRCGECGRTDDITPHAVTHTSDCPVTTGEWATMRDALLDVDGVGPYSAARLLREFGDVDGLCSTLAEYPEALDAVAGFTVHDARWLRSALVDARDESTPVTARGSP